ncbi:MAG: hypothetical protein K1X53_14210 [Candidatus Sumerlaeaceae bacterium]|nr:hypothetical protein [Candidatus Sumerlaeaceae bacterium]
MNTAGTKALRLGVAVLLAAASTMAAAQAWKPEVRQTGVEVLAKLNYQPKQVVVTPKGRVIFSLRAYAPENFRLAEVQPDGNVVPYPNPEWSTDTKPDGKGIHNPVGLTLSSTGVLWIADKGSPKQLPQFVGWDTAANKLVGILQMKNRPKRDTPLIQNLVMDTQRKKIYAAGVEVGTSQQTGLPILVVYDVETKSTRFISLNKAQFQPSQELRNLARKSTEVSAENIKPELNVPITIDPANEWVYFGFMGGRKFWRVKADDLANEAIEPADLILGVEYVGSKPISNSMAVDAKGRVYFSDEMNNGVGVYEPKGGYRLLAKDPILNAPTSIAIASDGYIYVTVARPQKSVTAEKALPGDAASYVLARVKQLP